MTSKREELWTGAFVLVAVGILVAVVLTVSGAFSSEGTIYRAYFRYAAGIAPAAPVRYGGLLAGKVEGVRVDPQDPRRIEVRLRVHNNIPVKTDSIAKITSLGPLGENYLEVMAGNLQAPKAPPGSVLRSRELVALSDLGDMISGLIPTAGQTMQTLNDRLTELKVTTARVNDLLGEENRKNIDGTLANLNAMLAETRPKLSQTLDNVQATTERLQPVLKNVQIASEKISPLLEDLKGTVKQANQTLGRVDTMLEENQPDIRATMIEIRKAIVTANEAVEMLKASLDRNGENVDAAMLNVRIATDNLKDLTDTIKRKPTVLVRGETGKDRQPGGTR